MEIFNGKTFFVSTEPTLTAKFSTDAVLLVVLAITSKIGSMLTGNVTFCFCKAVILMN